MSGFSCCGSLLLLLQRASLTNTSTSATLHSHASLSQHSSSSLSLHLLRQQMKNPCATPPQHPGTHKPEQPMFLHHFALPFIPEALWDALSPAAVSAHAVGLWTFSFSLLWCISNLALLIQQTRCTRSTHISRRQELSEVSYNTLCTFYP